MFALTWFSFALLLAASLGAIIGVVALTLPARQTRTTLLFAFANLAAALWALGYFVEVGISRAIDLTLLPMFSAGWWLLAAEMVGLAAVPSLWFLFAASYTRRKHLLRGLPLAFAITSFVYALAVILTNPLHHRFADQAAAGAPLVMGPLAVVHWASTWALALWGIGMLFLDGIRHHQPAERRHAVALAVACLLALGGNVSFAVRLSASGAAAPTDPTPALFVLVNMVIGWGVVRHGLAGVVPLSAAQAFRTMSDAAIVCDARLVILTANEAAERHFPSVEHGVTLAEALPEVARHAEACRSASYSYLPFEAVIAVDVFWGRVYPTGGRDGRVLGYVVLLSDITDLREAQRRLADTLERYESDLATIATERVADGA